MEMQRNFRLSDHLDRDRALDNDKSGRYCIAFSGESISTAVLALGYVKVRMTTCQPRQFSCPRNPGTGIQDDDYGVAYADEDTDY